MTIDAPYLNCRDCGDARPLINDVEHGGQGQWYAPTFEAWVRIHLDGRCDDAKRRNDGQEVPDDTRLYLSREQPGPQSIVPPPVEPAEWRYSYQALNARASQGDLDAIDDLMMMTGAPGRAYRQAKKQREAPQG
jgi:hypothetical protein